MSFLKKSYGPWLPEKDGLESLKADFRAVYPSPDGKSLLCQGSRFGKDYYEAFVEVIDWETGGCSQELNKLPRMIHYISSPPYSPAIAICGFNDTAIRLFSYPSINFIDFIGRDDESAYHISFSSDFSKCAIGYSDGIMQLWDIKSMTPRQAAGHQERSFKASCAGPCSSSR